MIPRLALGWKTRPWGARRYAVVFVRRFSWQFWIPLPRKMLLSGRPGNRSWG